MKNTCHFMLLVPTTQKSSSKRKCPPYTPWCIQQAEIQILDRFWLYIFFFFWCSHATRCFLFLFFFWFCSLLGCSFGDIRKWKKIKSDESWVFWPFFFGAVVGKHERKWKRVDRPSSRSVFFFGSKNLLHSLCITSRHRPTSLMVRSASSPGSFDCDPKILVAWYRVTSRSRRWNCGRVVDQAARF